MPQKSKKTERTEPSLAGIYARLKKLEIQVQGTDRDLEEHEKTWIDDSIDGLGEQLEDLEKAQQATAVQVSEILARLAALEQQAKTPRQIVLAIDPLIQLAKEGK